MTINTPQITGHFTLGELGLVDAPIEEAFDNLTRLASDLLGTPVSLISIVQPERNRQYFKSHLGLPAEWAEKRQTPLSHSFCQHVVAADAPLLVDDAPNHPVLRTNKAIEDLNVVAYMGVPIHDPSNTPVGAFCVIEGVTRIWSEEDKIKLTRLGACLDDLIRLRASLKTSDALRREQEEFTYAISHDLKSPANTMKLLHSELSEVLGDETDGDARELLDHMKSTATRMGELVDGVLGYTQVVGDEMDMETVELAPIIKGIIGDSRGYITSYGARVATGVLPAIRGDKLQLRVLFQNLICNALKFRRPGVVPEITIYEEPTGPIGFVRVCVQDNGIGISRENQERVFSLFQRLNLRDDYPGSGLGLSLCKRIVANHAGAIDIRSEEGMGSTFVVTLPEAAV
jgi:signal transduction histidine kinase